MRCKKVILFLYAIIFFLWGEKNASAQADTFNYVSDTIQTWVVPGCVTQVTVKLWAGGGGGGNDAGFFWELTGGSSSYYEGVLSGLTRGTVLDLYVPSGGKFSDTLYGGIGGWPGGGQGGWYFQSPPLLYCEGAGGGGYAAVRINGTWYVVAGAGGGSGTIFAWGGSGGATSGGNGGYYFLAYYGGYGGTISHGGAPGYSSLNDTGTSGFSFVGGNGGGSWLYGTQPGGGGGGGYYGGGGGGDGGQGGGGGSSYPASTFTSGGITFTPISNIQGNVDSVSTNALAPGSPPDTTIGMGGYMQNGGNGLIIIYTGIPKLTSAVSSQTNPTCGICNGSITATDSGGSSPYTYSWAPTGQTSQTATGLCADTYTVTVTDSCGSTATTAITLTAIPITVNATVNTEDKCHGECNGSASASIVLGTSPYTYNWQPGGQNTATATGLCAGIYTITVTDKNGCTGTATVTITQPTAIVLTDTVINPLCYAGTGSAAVTANGGYSSYTYSWNPTAQTTATATGLSARTYTVTVTDSVGCTATISTTITQPTQVTANTSISSNILCNGGTGNATVSVTGGYSPYTYSWNPTAQTTATATGLSSRTYTVTVQDNNGCSATATINMTQPAVLSDAISSVTHASCNLSNGKATVTVSGGTTPYTYLWTPSAETTANATGLSVGNYSVAVKDKDGCTASATVSITEPSLVTAAITATTNISCFNGGNGSATVTAGGGSTPYTYLWSPSAQTTATATGLFAVSFTATVTDANGCTATTRTTLTQPTQVTVSITEPRIICKDSTGTLIANASGGTNPYKYTWSTGVSSTNNTLSITPISTVYYTVTVTDANGCTASNSITLQYGPSFMASITGKGSVCAGDSATICANAVGALDGTTYLWEPENKTNACITITPTQATVYTVTVIDGCGASTTASTNVSIVPSPKVNMYANFYQGCEPLCIQFQNGTTLSQGKISQYIWSFNLASGERDTSFLANPIHCYPYSGSYNVSLTVVSDSGCSATLERVDMITVYSPPKAAFTYSPNPTTIENPTITFTDESRDASDSGSNGGIVYRIWSFGDGSDSTSYASNPSHTYKDTGTYCASLFVMNSGGCTDTATNCLVIDPAFKLYIPSAFTPNGDERNETFQAVGQYVKSFEMYIFDRWGSQIYHSTNINDGWNGKVNGNGSVCQEDVYVYKITVMDSKDIQHSYIGDVTLIK